MPEVREDEAVPVSRSAFVLISSLCGIVGKETAASYAAGNSYLAALAEYRVSKGSKAVSLDLGMMADAGLLARSGGVDASEGREMPGRYSRPLFKGPFNLTSLVLRTPLPVPQLR